MAATVSANLTLFSAADDNTGGTWTGGSGAFDTEVFYQGSASWFYQTGKNTRSSGDFVPTTGVDMSATDNHLYWWMMCAVMTFTEPKRLGTAASSGLTCRVESSATDFVEWHVAGSDTWGGEWRCFVLDLNNASNNATTGDIYVSGGTLNLASVTKVTWFTDNSNSGTIRIVDNTAIDAVRFGTGLTAYGTDFNYDDIATEDALVANKYGIIQKIDGVYFIQGKIIIDDNAGTTTFNSTAETIAFRDINCSTGLFELSFTGTGNTTVLSGLSVLSSGINDNTRFAFDASGTVGSFTMSGASLNRSGVVDFKAGQTITTSVFNNTYQVDPSTASFNNNTLSNYVGTDGGALLWPASTNTHTLKFINCDEGVEITQVVDQDFVGMDFDETEGSPFNNFDVHLNNGGTSITVALDSASDANSYTATGGGVVTFASSVTLSMIVKDEAGAFIETAYAYIDDNNAAPFIMNTTTNASGLASVNHTAGAVTGSTWRVRKYGYKAYIAIVDIASANISIPVTLIADPQQT